MKQIGVSGVPLIHGLHGSFTLEHGLGELLVVESDVACEGAGEVFGVMEPGEMGTDHGFPLGELGELGTDHGFPLRFSAKAEQKPGNRGLSPILPHPRCGCCSSTAGCGRVPHPAASAWMPRRRRGRQSFWGVLPRLT